MCDLPLYGPKTGLRAVESVSSNKKPALLGAGCVYSPLRIVSYLKMRVKGNIKNFVNSLGMSVAARKSAPHRDTARGRLRVCESYGFRVVQGEACPLRGRAPLLHTVTRRWRYGAPSPSRLRGLWRVQVTDGGLPRRQQIPHALKRVRDDGAEARARSSIEMRPMMRTRQRRKSRTTTNRALRSFGYPDRITLWMTARRSVNGANTEIGAPGRQLILTLLFRRHRVGVDRAGLLRSAEESCRRDKPAHPGQGLSGKSGHRLRLRP